MSSRSGSVDSAFVSLRSVDCGPLVPISPISVMGQTLRKMKKRSRGRNKKIDPEDFEELSSSSWVSTLPSRYSTMSCPTDESTTYSTTKTTEQSGLSQTQSTELSNAQSSTVVPSYSTVAVDKTRKVSPSGPMSSSTTVTTPKPLPKSPTKSEVSDDCTSESLSQSTSRSSNTSADYSELESIGNLSQPGEVVMTYEDFQWIEAVEAFLTDEVMCHTIAPQRRPILSVRGKKPSGFAKGYRNLYRNLMNKKSPTGK
ncbi:hypothetical protein QR680_017130 [Steinernema hermaphroditum]|uniref:Uncharacterized protein n=1 Tax=Steinernema hermaphroditum TaxID=289476 RepID=A0AA39LNG1_9BILA|nr:hypothetical protein QR680_017130 [Steinernema hermaphroditum]